MPSAQSIRLAKSQATADLQRLLSTIERCPLSQRGRYVEQLVRIVTTHDATVPAYVRQRPGDDTVSSLIRRTVAAVKGFHGPAIPYRLGDMLEVLA